MKRLIALLMPLLLCSAMAVTAYAHEAPDLSQIGSITVAMAYDGRPVPGGMLTLYRVGAVAEEDGTYRFVPTGDFIKCGAALRDPESSELAESLAAYASANRLTGTEVEIGGDGTAAASGLALGLYLVVQTGAAEGYEAVAPFLVSVPMEENGSYVYAVDATPKLSTLTPVEPTPSTPAEPATPTPAEPTPPTPVEPTPTTPAPPTTPANPAGPTLPQTGQLNWPVPVLAALGLALFAAGWALRFGRRQEQR